MPVVALPVTLVAVMLAVVALNVVITPAVEFNVTAPKATTGEPLVTLLPAVIVNVLLPMLKVPNVCVMPAPLVARSDLIVTAPVTVVLYALTVVFVAKSSMPPLKVNALLAAPKAATLATISVPLWSVVPPV